MKFDIDSPILKKVFAIGSIVVAGVMAVSEAIESQKKEKEFEELKQKVSELEERDSQ